MNFNLPFLPKCCILRQKVLFLIPFSRMLNLDVMHYVICTCIRLYKTNFQICQQKLPIKTYFVFISLVLCVLYVLFHHYDNACIYVWWTVRKQCYLKDVTRRLQAAKYMSSSRAVDLKWPLIFDLTRCDKLLSYVTERRHRNVVFTCRCQFDST